MHHDRVDPGLFEHGHILGEHLAERGITHGMAAIFDDDRLALVALHIGQGFGNQPGLHGGFDAGIRVLDVDAHGRVHLCAARLARS